jgi:hypothetical protein
MIVICSNKTDAQIKTVQPHLPRLTHPGQPKSGFPHLQNAHVIAFCTTGPSGSALFVFCLVGINGAGDFKTLQQGRCGG